MTEEQLFNTFLSEFMPLYKEKSLALNRASWNLETTGDPETAQTVARLDKELKVLFSDPKNYEKLLSFRKSEKIHSPQLQRVLHLLILYHKGNMVPEEMLEKVSRKEAEIAEIYIGFRPVFEGKKYTENDLLDILKKESDIERRKGAWNAGKEIGEQLAPHIVELVKARNEIAHKLGYSDFYQMQLDLQETRHSKLFEFLEKFAEASSDSYDVLIQEINRELAGKYGVPEKEIGPWSWSDPFCQEDPLSSSNLDSLLKGVDLVKAAREFYTSLGFHIDPVLHRSDLFEREKKNQHAFCTHIDRKGDVRILTNLRPTMRWLDTLLHELGHAVYELGYDDNLPWILRSPPHMITTEAVALVTGRQAYDPTFLRKIVKGHDVEKEIAEATETQRRRQFIFSRWVLVMVHFEASLYAKPDQDLNALWWSLVKKYQKINPPPHREKKKDWACKYHIALAPVYYHSYLLGEFFASMLKESFVAFNNTPSMYGHPNLGSFLRGRLFYPGNRMRWDILIETMLGKPLEYEAWLKEFGE